MATKKISSKKKTATKSSARASATRAAAKPAKKQSVTPTALALASLAPGLTVNDIEASLAWYRDVLDFEVKERWEFEGKLRGVELGAGRVTFMLGQDDWMKGRDRIKGQGIRLYGETSQDVDALAAKIKQRGGILAQEPKDQPWGVRDLAIDDPDGFKITIMAALKKKKGK